MLLRSPILTVMVKAALKAGRGLKRDLGEISELQVSLKGPANYVSIADKRAEATVYEELRKARPDYGFLMEESGAVAGNDKSHRWLVDPLDGTTNFLHGIPHFAVSIGLERDGVPVAGVVYNPATDDLFTAERGKGAFLNDRRLRVAARPDLSNAVISCGIPHLGRGDHERFRKELTAVQAKAAGVRRFGAAALDLAWVAAGRLDGYWERDLSAWDMGAGIVLVREAGGYVTDAEGRDTMLECGSIVAGNEAVNKALLGLIGGA